MMTKLCCGNNNTYINSHSLLISILPFELSNMKSVAAFATPSPGTAPSSGISSAVVEAQTSRRAFVSIASSTAVASFAMNFDGHSASCQCAGCGPHAAGCACSTCAVGHSSGCQCSNCLSSHSMSCQCGSCMTSGFKAL